MVYVLVGADKKRFAIYKGLICHHSKVFRRALNDSSLAASNKGIELWNVSPAIFELIYIWLNHGEFTQSVGGHDIPCTTTQITWLYIYGEKLGMPKLCNKAVDVLVQSYRNEGIRPLDLSQIYQHTPLTFAFAKTRLDLIHDRPIANMASSWKCEAGRLVVSRVLVRHLPGSSPGLRKLTGNGQRRN